MAEPLALQKGEKKVESPHLQKKQPVSPELLGPHPLEYMYPSPEGQAEFSSEVPSGRRRFGECPQVRGPAVCGLRVMARDLSVCLCLRERMYLRE